jgi:hypothetical protein
VHVVIDACMSLWDCGRHNSYALSFPFLLCCLCVASVHIDTVLLYDIDNRAVTAQLVL